MRIALPLTSDNAFSAHYGAAAKFVVFEVDRKERAVLRRVVVEPQSSEPCGWPPLLRAAGAKLVLAGGMGRRAHDRMTEHGLKVLVGMPDSSPEAIIAAWLAGTLEPGENSCDGGAHLGEHHDDHGHEHGCGCSD
jgi:predicted Fe-Mo cluster-binding NifX family protein